MFRISCQRTGPGTLLIRPEGSFVADCVSELRAAIAQAIESDCQVILDLSGLQYVDNAGLLELRAMERCGVSLRSASPFVSELLKRQNEAE